jgi:mannosyltransferase OCH1-like enzyme
MTLIPKTIHQVWIGPNPIPQKELEFIDSWKRLHPEWKFLLWTNDNINKLHINETCKKAIDNLSPMYACQADIIRYIAVNEYGGFYIDTDIQCFKPIDDIINNHNFIGLQPRDCNYITNAFFGSTASNSVLDLAIKNIDDKKHTIKNPYGPVYLTKSLTLTANHKEHITLLQNENHKVLGYNFWSNQNKDKYCRHHARASWRKV